MSIIRVEKNNNYTVIGTYHLKDKNLSLKAKGLLSVVLSLPDDWQYSIKGLANTCKESITAITSTLNELKANHYLIINKTKSDKDGKFEYEYVFFEKALEEGVIPNIENPDIENPDMENPVLEVPVMENLGLNKILNNKILNNKILNNKNKKENIKEKEKDSSCGAEAPLSNTEDVGRYSDANASSSGADAPMPPKDENVTKDLNEKLIHNFNILWEIYPRKDGKNEAFKHYKAWLKGKEYAGEKKKLTNEQMWYSIKKYNEDKANTEKQFLKMGSTFFNQTIYEYAPSLEEIKEIENDSG